MAVHSGPDIITNGLIYFLDGSNLKCYSGSGTSLTNLVSGQVTTGTMNGGVSYNAMPQGFFSFDGTDDYIQCGSVGGGDLVTGTLSIWYSIKSVQYGGSFSIGTSAYEAIFAKQNEFGIFVFGNPAGIEIVSYDWGNGTNRAWVPGSLPLDGTWTNLTLTFDTIDGANPSNNAKAYVNGVLNTTFSYKRGTVPKPQDPLRMGAQGSSGTPIHFLGSDARLNYPMVYNRILDQSEILQNYYAIKGRLGV